MKPCNHVLTLLLVLITAPKQADGVVTGHDCRPGLNECDQSSFIIIFSCTNVEMIMKILLTIIYSIFASSLQVALSSTFQFQLMMMPLSIKAFYLVCSLQPKHQKNYTVIEMASRVIRHPTTRGGPRGKTRTPLLYFPPVDVVRIGTQKPTMGHFTFLVEAIVGGTVAAVTSPAERLIRTVFLKSRRCNWPAQEISCSGLQHFSGLGNGRV